MKLSSVLNKKEIKSSTLINNINVENMQQRYTSCCGLLEIHSWEVTADKIEPEQLSAKCLEILAKTKKGALIGTVVNRTDYLGEMISDSLSKSGWSPMGEPFTNPNTGHSITIWTFSQETLNNKKNSEKLDFLEKKEK